MDQQPDPDTFDAITSHPDLADLGRPAPDLPPLSAVMLTLAVLGLGGGGVVALIVGSWLPVIIGAVSTFTLVLAAVVYAAATATPNRHHKRR